MTSATMKKCRVCGKEYEACRSANQVSGIFHWQEVACSPECGAIYLRQIKESRGLVSTPKRNSHKRITDRLPVSTELPVIVTVDMEQAGEASADIVNMSEQG